MRPAPRRVNVLPAAPKPPAEFYPGLETDAFVYVFCLPLPPPETSPNWRGHWGAKARAVRQCRSSVIASFSNPLDAPQVRLVFYFADARRRDKDNFLARCKPYFDGLTDRGVWRDDSAVTHLPSEFRVDRANPRLEIHVWEGQS